MKVSFELLMAIVMIAFDGCFFDRPVYAFNLAIGPGCLIWGDRSQKVRLNIVVTSSLLPVAPINERGRPA